MIRLFHRALLAFALLPGAAAAINITTNSIPNGTVGSTYSTKLNASGAQGSVTWEVSSGSLPSGLLLVGSTIAGIPLRAGSSSFVVRAADRRGDDTQALSMTVYDVVTITTTTLPGATVGAAYSQTVSANGGDGNYTWSRSGTLPNGLSLSAAGVISGTPTAAGTSAFTVSVSDSGNRRDSQSLSIAVSAATPPLTITTSSLPNGTVGSAYSQTLAATGGSGGYSWAASPGLPRGLSLSSAGVLSGTPLEAGASSFTVTVRDSSNRTANQQLSMTVDSSAPVVTTSTLPAGTVGVAYSATLSASGGSGGNTWTVTGGSLPAGLALSGAGEIAGTPTAPGNSTFTATVTDNGGRSGAKSLTISIGAPALTVTTSSLPGGTVGAAYSATLAASGGSGGNQWSVTNGSLPAGLTLSAAGAISGTPTAAGTANVTVGVADSAGHTASKALTIAIDVPTLTVTTTSLPGGTVGAAYSATLAASGGSGGNQWSVTNGSLPAGLTLSAAGAISGTPTAAGTANVTVGVADSAGHTASKALTIAIDVPTLTVTTTSLPGGTVGTAYSATLAASGGSGGNQWSVTNGTLPAGLTLNAAGAITGTPTAAGSSSFTVGVTDSAGHTASKALTLGIDVPTLTVTTTSLQNGTVGVAYSATLAASGGSGGNQWSVTNGSLPAGLTLSAAGAITGTPTAAGSSSFTVGVTDSASHTASKALTLGIDVPTLTVTTTSLPNGTVGVAYSATLAASGGSGGNQWSVTNGTLPAGLTLSAAGALTGTPTTAGNSSFTVGVTDSANHTASKALTLGIDVPTLTINTASLPNGTVGVAYTASLDASGGSGGNQWTVTNGSLPAGLSLSAAGAITGTPTTAGSSSFTVGVTDSASHTASKALTLGIDVPTLTINTSSLPNGMIGVAYSQTLDASGGAGSNRWTVSGGALPAGLTLSPTGAIAGTPTAIAASNFTVTVTDSANHTASKALTITVDPATLTINTSSLPNGVVGTAYSQNLDVSGGTGGNAWTVSAGALPAGLTLSAAGAITGTPTTAGASNFTVTVTDNANHTASKALTLTIGPPALTVMTVALPSAIVGVQYSHTLTASGGAGGNVWSVASGALPGGLTLSQTGTIAGIPTAPGAASFTVQVKDSTNVTTAKALTLPVAAPTLAITTTSLPNGVLGSAYSQTLAATGGTGTYRWAVTAGSLPAGLTLDASAGKISGTITGGVSTFTIELSDGSGLAVTRIFSINVAPALSLPSAGTLPSGVTGAAYSGTITPVGGVPPYTFSVASGQLPPGLLLNARTGELTGQPAQVGSFTFAIQLRDSANAQTQSSYTVVIANTITITTPPILPSGAVGVAYQVTLVAGGGTSPYSWSATAGSLPAGVTLRPDGTISGTPTNAGTFTMTVAATDAVGAKISKDFTLTIVAALTIQTATQLLGGTPGAPYNAALAATGGLPPYVWTVSSGSLPSGLRLDPAEGTITGVPDTVGTANFTVKVTDSLNVAAQKAFTIAIAPGVSFTTPATLPTATAGEAYSFTLAASGGKQPYSWRVSDGALPDGLALNATSGIISGTATAAGTFNFTLEVSDSSGLKASRVHTIVVELPSVAALSVSGVPATLAPLQQPAVDVVLANPYPVAITGRLNLVFSPASGMPDDPSVQFSSGGRSATFTIAANDTHAAFTVPQLMLQSGSVAGSISFTVESLRAGSATLPAPSSPIGSSQVAPSVAVVRTVEVQRGSGGFSVVVTGASTTRDLTSVTVRFRPSAGATLQTTEATVDLTTAAKAWFTSGNSAQYGGQFTLTVPFTFVGGTSAIDSVGVVLTNSVGASTESSAQY